MMNKTFDKENAEILQRQARIFKSGQLGLNYPALKKFQRKRCFFCVNVYLTIFQKSFFPERIIKILGEAQVVWKRLLE